MQLLPRLAWKFFWRITKAKAAEDSAENGKKSSEFGARQVRHSRTSEPGSYARHKPLEPADPTAPRPRHDATAHTGKAAPSRIAACPCPQPCASSCNGAFHPCGSTQALPPASPPAAGAARAAHTAATIAPQMRSFSQVQFNSGISRACASTAKSRINCTCCLTRPHPNASALRNC